MFVTKSARAGRSVAVSQFAGAALRYCTHIKIDSLQLTASLEGERFVNAYFKVMI